MDTRNFKNLVRDDILTAVAGPVSNFITAFLAVIVLTFLVHAPMTGRGGLFRGTDVAGPLSQMFELAILINVVLAVFNLIPLPPLDGSHVIRHFLSYETLKVYDRIGYFGLVIIMFVLPMLGLPIINIIINPFLGFFYALLNFFLRL